MANPANKSGASFDMAVGLDEPTLNTLMSQVYGKISSVLAATIDVNTMGISTVAFAVKSAPTVSLAPSTEVVNHMKSRLNKYFITAGHDDPSGMADKMAAANASKTVGVSSLNNEITINYTGGQDATVVSAAITASVSITTLVDAGQNSLTATITSLKVAIADNLVIEALINNAFAQLLISYLNENILKSVKIPSLSYSGFSASMPVPVVNAPFLTAYSNVGNVQPTDPAMSGWPSGCVYLASDSAALIAASGTVLPIGPSADFNWKIITGVVSAQVLKPSHVVVNGDGSIVLTVEANAKAQLTIHTVWPLDNFSFGPKATAGLKVTCTVAVVDGQVMVTPNDFPIPSFSFEWSDFPNWINLIMTPLNEGLGLALNAVLGPLIKDALSSLKIPVYKIPNLSITVGKEKMGIQLENATTGAINGMLLVKAEAVIS